MKTLLHPTALAAALLALAVTTAPATPVDNTLTQTFSGNATIPDNNASGLAFSFNFSAPAPVVISGLTIDLNLVGGWNGDLYAYLSHGSSLAVLLNRIGRTASNPDGSGTSGMTVEFSDLYSPDIHNFAGGVLTGNFAADGRNVNPLTALDTDARTASLGNFLGADPNGSWTLFFADLSPAAVATVQSWTVSVGTTVPEPATATLLGAAVLLGLIRRTLPTR
jgi:subtilisin-like proprotein convertase family protein